MTPLFAQGAFQIDPNASPEQIKRKRQPGAWLTFIPGLLFLGAPSR